MLMIHLGIFFTGKMKEPCTPKKRIFQDFNGTIKVLKEKSSYQERLFSSVKIKWFCFKNTKQPIAYTLLDKGEIIFF